MIIFLIAILFVAVFISKTVAAIAAVLGLALLWWLSKLDWR